MTALKLPQHARILVVALRRLGDVLLTTPLIRSLKRAFPDAAIDALVFSGTEGLLAGNSDLAGVLTLPARPTNRDSFVLVRRLWRRYDLAVSTQTGDRPTLFAWTAGRVSAGPVVPNGIGPAVKRLVLDHPIAANEGCHRIEEVLSLAAALDIPPVAEVVCPLGAVRADLIPKNEYAIIHAGPMFRYKRWTEQGWRGLATALAERGLVVVTTGGPALEDQRYLNMVWGSLMGVRRFEGVLSWPELAALIGSARVYIGPDTSVTHLAAATGVPTVALYGPTDPRRWGPWPIGGLERAWAAAGTIQQRGNVWLVQNPLPCMPCQKEGCERRLDSYSQCLDKLSVQQVLTAVDGALARRVGSVIDATLGLEHTRA